MPEITLQARNAGCKPASRELPSTEKRSRAAGPRVPHAFLRRAGRTKPRAEGRPPAGGIEVGRATTIPCQTPRAIRRGAQCSAFRASCPAVRDIRFRAVLSFERWFGAEASRCAKAMPAQHRSRRVALCFRWWPTGAVGSGRVGRRAPPARVIVVCFDFGCRWSIAAKGSGHIA